MKKLRYINTPQKLAYMKSMQEKNRISCQKSNAEFWMLQHLSFTGYKWTRQAIWGFRLFDFWNGYLGVAVEVDGLEHNKNYDSYRDEYNYKRSGIVVLRVRNFNEEDALKAIEYIKTANTWTERRKEMGLLTKAQKKQLGILPV